MLRAAIVQMTSTPDREHNLTAAKDLLDSAVAGGAQLVAFPENFTLLAEGPQMLRQPETVQGPTVTRLKQWAKDRKCWILAGSLALKKSGSRKLANTSLLIDSRGKIRSQYQKIHLFDAHVRGDRSYRESKIYQAGKKVVRVKTPWGQFGMSVCYDLRFPELYRKMYQGATSLWPKLLFIPSAFTVPTGKAHWHTLIRARAIENQSYILAPAQTGENYPGRETYGHSLVVDPWGKTLAEITAHSGFVCVDLDLNQVSQVRGKLPALKNRRL